MNTNYADYNHERMNEHYDPENDIGTPEVTWVDYELLGVIKDLIEKNEELEARIDELEKTVKAQDEVLVGLPPFRGN
jgi:hypothetical protein